MIWIAIALLSAGGVFLSALFSGSETGFYRITRVRLVLDARGGDMIAKGLWWLSNRPSLFIATTLVGNNIANYLVSLAIVLAAGALTLGHFLELAAPVLLSPLLFVYGELLPKNLYLEAPNLLLRRSGPLILFFSVILSPLSVSLWGLSKLLEYLSGQSPQKVQLNIARRELASVLDEGHQVGILLPAQRQLAQGLFAVASQPVTDFTQPVARLVRGNNRNTREELLRLATRNRLAEVPIEDARSHELVGYVRAVDLRILPGKELPVRELVDVEATDPHIAALVKLHTANASMGRVLGPDHEVIGVVTSRQLRSPLFRGGR